jgi:flavodoxin
MKTSDEILLSSLFDRFTKYLNDNDSNIVFKYENNKVKYCIEDNQHKAWYDWYDIYDPIKDIDLKDERLNFFIGEHDSFFSCPFRDKSKYQIVNKCINFFHNSTSLEELVIKMDLMGI